MNDSDLNIMLTAYIECALWSSCDEDGDCFDHHKYSGMEFSEETLTMFENDCRKFVEQAGDMIDNADFSQLGHDFWLTRNHHGAGFWDRKEIYGSQSIADKLTALAHEYRELYVVEGSDGFLWCD